MSDELKAVLARLDRMEVAAGLSTERLWGVEQIAAYMDMSPRTAARVVLRDTFPQAVNPTDCPTAKGRRWFPDEVKAWFRDNRETRKRA